MTASLVEWTEYLTINHKITDSIPESIRSGRQFSHEVQVATDSEFKF